ncbi:Rv3654c family TadE-like protein [Scrofimicrobium sp. R131]|uniref:Pilus assembly protein TadG-related protein n=1 Tax=Scrofimicrobium appendicitidis TaxID=3079930 RepID=A0AAU7V7W6_9ACTO
MNIGGDPNVWERGSATVTAVGMTLALLLVGGVLIAALGVQVERTKTQAAVDLAALAGAASAPSALVGSADPSGPCAVAEEVAAANRVELVDCFAREGDLWVRAEGSVRVWWGQSWGVPARARAGPAGTGELISPLASE